jgi:K+-transporting ATPase ATPase C chain
VNLRTLRTALSLLLAMTVLLGMIYPAVITGIARVAFPRQAAGGLIYRNGQLIGSHLIGQNFSSPGYFWGRPSATAPQPYNALASNGSNLGPLNPALLDQVHANAAQLRDADPGNSIPIPVDLVTASASGLDPDISPAGALFQLPRVARARGLEPARLEALIAEHTRARFLGFVGEKRVNVLELNLALDTLR